MKEKIFTRACPVLPNAQGRASLGQKTLLTYVYLRLLHYTHSVIFKSLLGPFPRLHFEQFIWRQKTTWPLGQMGHLHSKDIARFLKYTNVLLFDDARSSCPPARIMLFLISVQGTYCRPGLNGSCDPVLSP